MISHRALRDIQRCRLKYGDAWTEYEKRVPYLFIPVRPASSFCSVSFSLLTTLTAARST